MEFAHKLKNSIRTYGLGIGLQSAIIGRIILHVFSQIPPLLFIGGVLEGFSVPLMLMGIYRTGRAMRAKEK